MRDVWSQLKTLAEVDARIAEVEAFNQVGMVMSILCDAQAELFRDWMVWRQVIQDCTAGWGRGEGRQRKKWGNNYD